MLSCQVRHGGTNDPWSIPPAPVLIFPVLPLKTGMQGWGHQLVVPGHKHPSLQDQALFGCTPATFRHQATSTRFLPSFKRCAMQLPLSYMLVHPRLGTSPRLGSLKAIPTWQPGAGRAMARGHVSLRGTALRPG